MPKKAYFWITLLFTLFFIVALFGFLFLWTVIGSSTSIMISTGIQRMRIERLTKNVLILQNHPTILTRAAAISEIQDTLPLWQKTQLGLQIGDDSLGLPHYVSPDIHILIINSQLDYIPLLVAFQNIVKSPTSVDPIQVQIVLSHENAYLNEMSQVNNLWQNHINESYQQIFWIKTVLLVIILLLVVLNFWMMYPRRPQKEGLIS